MHKPNIQLELKLICPYKYSLKEEIYRELRLNKSLLSYATARAGDTNSPLKKLSTAAIALLILLVKVFLTFKFIMGQSSHLNL